MNAPVQMPTTNSSPALTSCIYEGWVRHRRFSPKSHQFSYQVFMMYLNLDEIDTVLCQNKLWSTGKYSPARFKRSDYFGDSSKSLKQCVKEEVFNQIGIKVTGSIFMLTNLRYFGYIMNPLTIYYCFNNKQQLEAMLLEVTNTPWGEKHHYVFSCDPTMQKHRTYINKELHVSPFNPMNMTYFFKNNTPNKSLAVHMENYTSSTKKNNDLDQPHTGPVFDATLVLKKREITHQSLTSILVKYPFMTLKVIYSIYWQALKLFIKKSPFYSNPKIVSNTQP